MGVSVLPSMYLQEEWAQSVGMHSANNLVHTVEVRGPMTVDQIRTVLALLVERHEPMRTALVPNLTGGLDQHVHGELDVDVPVVDLSEFDEQEQGFELYRLCSELAATPFDLDVAPLWRGLVVALGPQHHLAITCWHHVIFDGWSNNVLYQDFAAIARHVVSPDEHEMPAPLAVQIADVAHAERSSQMQGPLLDYWRAQFPTQPLRVPTEDAGHRVLPFTVRGVAHPALPAPQVNALLSFAGTKVGAAGALRALVVASLAPDLGDSVMVGLVYANRSHPARHRLIGLFSDHLLVRVDLHDNPTFADLALRMHRGVQAARAQQVPIGALRQVVPPQDRLPDGQLFDLSINYLPGVGSFAEQEADAGQESVTMNIRPQPFDMPSVRIERPFSAGVGLGYQVHHRTEGTVLGEIWGQDPRFSTETLARLGRRLSSTLGAVIAHPDAGVRDLDLD